LQVILATRFYPPDTGGGGIAAYARYAALGLLRHGHQVCVISQLASGSQAFQITEGVKVHRIPAAFTSYRWTRLPLVGRHVRLIQDIIYAWRVRQTLTCISRTWAPDIVEYADIDAEALFHPPLCPYVVKLHTPHAVLRNYYTPQEVSYARSGIEWLEARTIRHANGLSSPSGHLADVVAQLLHLDRAQISWIPNPIDTDFFSSGVESELESPPTVLYVGRLEPLKGAVVFARAIPLIAKAVPNMNFIYLGADRHSATGGSQKAELVSYFEQQGIRQRVQFYGHAAPEVFRDFYRHATVVVIPSLFENCPYTLLEAMACGKPVVASRAGGMTEMIDDGETGLLFETGNSADLAEKAIRLLQSPERRCQLGQAARATAVERYSVNKCALEAEKFYREVLARYRAH
jgi:glycosyltransferase involved in cell wall biosynthesis